MAATASPYGAIPDGSLSSSGSWSGKAIAYKIASAYNTSIFTGDFVKLVTAGVVEKDTGTAAMTPIGIAVGFEYTDPVTGQLLQTQYWPANTVAADAKCFVVNDPDVLFRIQANATLAQTALNANAEIVQTAGSTVTGRSKNALNAGTINSTATLPLRIVGFVEKPGSAVGDAFTDVICKINVGHQLVNTTGLA